MRSRAVALPRALRARAGRLRRDGPEAVVDDLDWIGAAAIERVAGPARSERAVARYRSRLYAGRAVECPVCDGRFRRFKPDWNRPDAICPACLSQERHRGTVLLFARSPELLATARRSLLHFAPEPGIERRLRALGSARYVTADLADPRADERFDITAIPYPDASFDALICSHVLEHVTDDRAALAELRRVLAPGGWALLMVPLDHGRATTLEDPAIVTPEQRRDHYWQADHVRLYGRDFVDRVAAAGFRADVVPLVDDLGPAAARRFGLAAEDVYVLASPRSARLDQ